MTNELIANDNNSDKLLLLLLLQDYNNNNILYKITMDKMPRINLWKSVVELVKILIFFKN